MNETSAGQGRVIYNLDCSEFFVETFGPIAPETIDSFVDTHVPLGITDLFINVNAKRTNYRSEVWEADWDGYDPNADDDQPFFAGLDPLALANFKSVPHTAEIEVQARHLGCPEVPRIRCW